MINDLVLFNLNDLALLLVIFNCGLFASILIAVNRGKAISNRLLACFLFAMAVEALDTLLYWSTPLKTEFFAQSSWLFISLKWGLLAQGPLLYLYTKSVIYSDFSFKPSAYKHLWFVPVYPLWMLIMGISLGAEGLQSGAFEYGIYFSNWSFRGLLLVQNLSIAVYGVLSFKALSYYRRQIVHEHSNLQQINQHWLSVLIGGFLLLWFWDFSSQLGQELLPDAFGDFMGLLGNYLAFVFVCVLVIFSLLQSPVVIGVNSHNNDLEPEGSKANPTEQNLAADQGPTADLGDMIPPEHIAKVEQAIEQEQVYLEADLTLEQLAARLRMQPRAVSKVINQHYQKNFFEFINFYRVEKAKQLLLQQPNLGMLDLMSDCGFNSKSAFNRFFKKYTEMTPTQYRNQAQAT